MDTRLLATLVRKDLLRVRRKPLAYVINLFIPLFMVGMVGFLFGTRGDSGSALGRIKMAVVDEDGLFFSEVLKGAMNRQEMRENMDLRLLSRDEAMEALMENEISAALIIPAGFSEGFVSGKEVPDLELVKNPAHYFHPAVIEELLGVLAEGGNGLYRVAGDEFPEWQAFFEEEGVPDLAVAAEIIHRMDTKFENAGKVLFPPLIQYRQVTPAASDEIAEEEVSFDLFAFLLPGFIGIFLFFIADHAIRDIFREEQQKTLDRYRTHNASLAPFMVTKVCVAFLVILACFFSLLFVGTALFGIDWRNFAGVLLFTAAYAVFVTGFIALLNAIVGSEKRADTFNPAIILAMALLGGNMIPVNRLPSFITEYASFLLPNYWYVRGMHYLQFEWDNVPIASYGAGMIILGLAFVMLGSAILRRRLERKSL